jgi:hypothetical protein
MKGSNISSIGVIYISFITTFHLLICSRNFFSLSEFKYIFAKSFFVFKRVLCTNPDSIAAPPAPPAAAPPSPPPSFFSSFGASAGLSCIIDV